MPDRARRSFTFWWFFQRFSGLILVATLMIHMLAKHFSLSEGPHRSHLDLQEIADSFSNPWVMLFYVVFLVTGTIHGLNGVYNVLDDYVRSPGMRILGMWAIWGVGLFVIIWGTLTLLT